MERNRRSELVLKVKEKQDVFLTSLPLYSGSGENGMKLFSDTNQMKGEREKWPELWRILRKY